MDQGGTANSDTRAGNLSGWVADQLRAAILDGELQAGEPIPQETLASRVGASRHPVREALRTLEGEGLVVLEPNKRARVTRLEAGELQLLYQARAALEPVVIQDSIAGLLEDQIRRAGEILAVIESGVDAIDFLLLDREFHLLTYAGCRSHQLVSIVERLWNSTQHYRRAFVTQTGEGWREVTNAEHRLLHDAVRRRNAEVAAAIVETHITRTRVELDRHPEIFISPHA